MRRNNPGFDLKIKLKANSCSPSICKLLILTTLAITFPSLTHANTGHAPEKASATHDKPLVSGKHSMVVTNNPLASDAAARMLKAGGNAIDAAIAASFVLGLTEPQSSGIGGGGYALVYVAKNKKLIAYDGREVAPHSATVDMFLDENKKPWPFKQAVLNAKSIGVPGEVALLFDLHQKHGKLAWETLLQPAIQLAEHGFKMSQRLHTLLLGEVDFLRSDSLVKEIYFDHEKIKSVGQIIKNPAYAKTLRVIASHPKDFYRGKLADEIIQAVNQQAHATLFDKKDFLSYQIKMSAAVCASYRTIYRICSVPPSSGGGVTLIELLKLYANVTTVDDPNWQYYFLEASKLAYADRNQYLADPAFIKQPVAGLIDDEYLKQRSELITDEVLSTPVAAGVPSGIDKTYAADASAPLPGTTSISIVDQVGNAISMTLTVESAFGSHIFTHGFFLNNEMTDFSFEEKSVNGQLIANRIEAGKRPRSSIAPAFVFNKQGQLLAVSGSPGGSEIICYVAKNLILMLDKNYTPQQASAAANLCAANQSPVIESTMSQTEQLTLEKKGEMLKRKDLVSGATNIRRNADGGWYGAADPRREGVAIGN